MSNNPYVYKMTEEICSKLIFIKSFDECYTHVGFANMVFTGCFDSSDTIKGITSDLREVYLEVAKNAIEKAKNINDDVIPFLHKTFVETVASSMASVIEYAVDYKNSNTTQLVKTVSLNDEIKEDYNLIMTSLMFGITTGSDPFLQFFVGLEKGTKDLPYNNYEDIYKVALPFIKFE